MQEIPWRQPDVAWNDYDCVVIRTPWDYQKEPSRFLEVLERIEASGTRLKNSLKMVRWNLEKTYLNDLARGGIPIVPTQWLSSLVHDEIAILCAQFQSEELVVKPIIGANADDTFRLPANASREETRNAINTFRDRDLMAQPFLPEIVRNGEYSLFYFDGDYSHCVLKTPKRGDFRVQEEHGGIIRASTPDSDLLAAGQCVINAIGEELLYARVDLVRMPAGDPALMEVELVEPSLYFSYDSESANRFAHALDRICGATEL